jgi:hypothetical protein
MFAGHRTILLLYLSSHEERSLSVFTESIGQIVQNRAVDFSHTGVLECADLVLHHDIDVFSYDGYALEYLT